MKAKLGEQIRFNKPHTIPLAKGGTAKIVPGDIARVMKKVDENTAEIMYLTGEAKGLSQKILLQVDANIDADSIVKKIMSDLNK